MGNRARKLQGWLATTFSQQKLSYFNVSLSGPLWLTLALSDSLCPSASLWLSLTLSLAHSRTFWLTLTQSGSLWLSLWLSQALIGSQGLCSAHHVMAAWLQFIPHCSSNCRHIKGLLIFIIFMFEAKCLLSPFVMDDVLQRNNTFFACKPSSLNTNSWVTP